MSTSEVTVKFRANGDGRRTSLTLPNGVTMTYSYDTASQLTGINYGSLGSLTYSYDLAGRRTNIGGSFARTGMPAALTGASYNADNQLTRFGSSNLTYDANGNLTSDGTNTYTWSARNQLISISGGVAANFQYDALGRRVSKTLLATTQFLYDGVNPVEELSGTTVTATMLAGFGVDEYFQRTDASGPADYLTDALGSTVALTGATGATLASYTYEAFGITTLASGGSANPYQFTGRENDATGLFYYRARYYSPTLQRFLSEDPIGVAAAINVYAYVGNDPILLTDRNGRCPMCIAAIIGGVLGGALAGYQAYQSGASGWNVVAAAAGGAGTGILAGLTGGLVGGAAIEAGASAIAAGAAGGAAGGASAGVTTGAVGLATGNETWTEAGENAVLDTAVGAGAGVVGVWGAGPVQGGWNFDPWNSPTDWGPRAWQLYWQTIISWEASEFACSLVGRKC